MRGCADDRRPGLREVLDLAQQWRCHLAGLGQSQQPVAHPVGQRDQAVLHRHAVQHNVRVAFVVIVAMARVGFEGLRRPLGLQVTNVRHEKPLPQQELAAGQVTMPLGGLLPPRFRAFVMLAPRPHHHAGPAVFGPGLQRVPVKHKPVDALAKRGVAQRLDRAGMLPPFLLVAGCEGLRADDSLPIDVPGRSHTPAGLDRAARGPEFSHRLIGHAAVGNGITRRTVGLHGET